jgi:hypothetical protein
LDTFDSIWNKVLLRCPSASSFLAQDCVRNAFLRLSEKRPWSWLVRYNQFLMPAVITAGTVAVTFNSLTVTGTGTGWTGAEVNRQFRIGNQTPIYTITAVDVAAQTLTLELPYGGSTASGVGYQIYQVYVTPPTDFNYFLTIWDPKYNWQLHRNVTQAELNAFDAQRTNQSSVAYVLASYLYDTINSPAMPRYELWPHQQAQYAYPFLYIARATDLIDSGAVLPRFIRGDMLLEMALAEIARWPGASAEAKNPYYDLALAKMHDNRADALLVDIGRQDDEVYETMVTYATLMPFAPLPWLDSSWMQSHSLGDMVL